ncbi:MAG: hypothetical protein SLAVMIC_00203 [uncultured marine phage]|uniref:Uncharacterized protein n=1 Tax=uncultured marine phage TaxID=707152 RepID=A0A8D9C8I7_9VIRU|nr:MAG: hypothetical protein SLAVMIC_00203 [uncultured marine phage]
MKFYRKFEVDGEDYFFLVHRSNELVFGYRHPNYKKAYERTKFGNGITVFNELKKVIKEWSENTDNTTFFWTADEVKLANNFRDKLFVDTNWVVDQTYTIKVNGKELTKYIYTLSNQ